MTAIEWILIVIAILLLAIEVLTYIGWIAMKNAYIKEVMRVCDEIEKIVAEQKRKDGK